MSLPSVRCTHAARRTRRDWRPWKGCVSVIVPIYNEAAHVEELLRAIEASPVSKEIVIVDDGSTDGTRDKLLALPAADHVTSALSSKRTAAKARPSAPAWAMHAASTS